MYRVTCIKIQANYKFSSLRLSNLILPSRENLKSFTKHNIAFWCKVVSLRTASKVKRKERKEICTERVYKLLFKVTIKIDK